MSQYHIVYPSGDQTKLSVVEICEGLEYELSDYSVASRERFDSEHNANVHAKYLAKEHAKSFISTSEENYLD